MLLFRHVEQLPIVYCVFWLAISSILFFAATIEAEADKLPPAMIMDVDGDQLVIEQKDIEKATAESSKNSRIYVCLSPAKANEHRKFTERNHGKTAKSVFAGEIEGTVTLSSVIKDNCWLLGPMRQVIARRLSEIFLGQRRTLDLESFNPVQSGENCPEKLFVDICLKRFLGYDDIKKFSESRNWKWNVFVETEFEKGGNTIVNENIDITVVEENLQYADNKVLCSVSEITAFPESKQPVCSIDFPLIRDFLNLNGSRTVLEISSSRKVSSKRMVTERLNQYTEQWILEKGSWRSLIQAQTNEVGHESRYYIDRFKVPSND